MKKRTVAVALAMILVLAGLGFAELSWTLRAPSLSNFPFEQVLWDGKQYIAFGGNKVVATSPNGEDWVPHDAPFTYFQQAASSGKVTVAVDADLSTSTDGVNWESVALPPNWCCFNSIYWTGKRFLLNGVFDGVDSVAISEDGKNWSLSSLGAPTMGSAQSYAVSGDTVVMAGRGGIFTSFDHGLSWSPVASSPACVGLVRAGGMFIVLTQDGQIQTSPDGVVWNDRTGIVDTLNALSGRTDQSWSEAGYLNGKIFLAGSTFFETSDLVNWSENSSLLSRWSMARSSSPTRKQNVILANENLFILGDAGAIWGGKNGADWTLRSRAVTLHHLRSVASGAGSWVAVGDSGTIVRSTDGKSWSLVDAACGADLTKVVFAQGGFQVLGDSGVLLSSKDGVGWERKSIGVRARLLDAIWSDSIKIVVADSNRVYSSTDGVAWSGSALLAGDRIRFVSKSRNGFLLAGTFGLSFSSADGKSWTSNGDGAIFRSPEAMTWNGSDVVIASQGKLYSSDDGKAWKSLKESFDARAMQLYATGGDLLLLLEDGRIRLIRGDEVGEAIGGATGGILSMAISDSLLVQVGAVGSILSAPNQGVVGVRRRSAHSGTGGFRVVGNRLEIELSAEAVVQFVVADLKGREQRRSFPNRLSAGSHSLPLGSLNGLYILRVRIGNDRWQTLKSSKF